MIQPKDEQQPMARWADRGWYLAIEYGVLARDRFLTRLPRLRKLGRFQELLEPGGKILYRNLFREEDVKPAWELLTALRPWHDRLVCYLNGAEVALKEVHDVLWCAAFLATERPCRAPEEKKERMAGCPGARLQLGPGRWDRDEPRNRHVMTFTEVDEAGTLVFDRAAIAEFIDGGRNALCPISPARDPVRFAKAFADTPVRALGWALVAEMGKQLRKRLSTKTLEQEHGFVLDDGIELGAHAQLELALDGEEPTIRLPGLKKSIGGQVRLPIAARRVLADGIVLRGVRVGEAYVRRKGGHYDLEQRFVLSTRVQLLPADRSVGFEGYDLATFPRATPEYANWVERAVEALP